MSEPLRIAFVVEGKTDYMVLKEIVRTFLGDRDFEPRPFQPEMSDTFQQIESEYGFGWPGVCRWCLQASEQAGGKLRDNFLFDLNDMLIVQLDADVAEKSYSDGRIDDPFPYKTLPCEEPCPPPSATTNRLRQVILRWMGEQEVPPKTVVCTPSKALETWLLVGLFPDDSTVQKDNCIECRKNPDSILQGKPQSRKLVSSGGRNIFEKYVEFSTIFVYSWDNVKKKCSEAKRFENDFRNVFGSLSLE